MKLALLSDIHSNRQALDACLQHARAHGADHFALLGDLVGYGADPAYVVQQAMDLVAAGYTVIGGNHDAFAVQPPAGTDKGAHSMAAQGALWTHEQLSHEQRSFFKSTRCTPAVPLSKATMTGGAPSFGATAAAATKPALRKFVTHARPPSTSKPSP